MKTGFYLQILLSVLVAKVYASCTVGEKGCRKIRSYDRYQNAVCMTSDIILNKMSHGKHQCDGNANACWYQCMLSKHSIQNGEVKDDCACHHEEHATGSGLDKKCFDPTGDSCDWYKVCLEERYPCEHTKYRYAIKHGEKYCELYKTNKNMFSDEGKKWIAAVRKCLQKALVPLLREWMNEPCDSIKKKAFDSHVKCYEDPLSDQSLGFCDLSKLDQFMVGYTLIGAFFTEPDATFQGMKDLVLKCSESWAVEFSPLLDISKKVIKIIIKIPKFVRLAVSILNSASKLVKKIVDALAELQRWRQIGLTWFGLLGKGTSSDDTIEIFFTSKRTYDLNAASSPEVNVTGALEALAQKIQDKKLALSMADGDQINIESMTACRDLHCLYQYSPVKWT